MSSSAKCIGVMALLSLVVQASLLADAPPATQPINIEFLDGAAGRAAIVDDSADPYFARLEEHEMTAKTHAPITGEGHEGKLAECKKRYQSAVQDFTPEDKETLTWYIAKIDEPLKRDYPLFGNTPWSFIKVASTLEGGMPHTRGGHIVMPAGVLSRFTLLRKGSRANERFVGGASLLIHEQTHVLERLHPDVFVPLFTQTFHFIQAKRIEQNSWLTARQLINPDGTVCNWILPITEDGKPTYILPLLAFNDLNATSLTAGMGTIAVTMEPAGDGYKPVLDTDGNPIVRPLNEVPGYMQSVGGEQNNYHPNEIIADRFAQLVMMDDLLDSNAKAAVPAARAGKMEERLKPIRDWAKVAFAEAAPVTAK